MKQLKFHVDKVHSGLSINLSQRGEIYFEIRT